MFKYFLLILFPFSVLAQNELSQTHTAIFFKNEISKTEQLNTLKRYGNISSELVQFINHPVVFVETGMIDQLRLLEEPLVEHVSPIYMNSTHEFVTYRSNFFVKLFDEQDISLLEREASELGVEIIGPNRFMSDIIELRSSKFGISPVEAVKSLKATELFELVNLNLMHSIRDCSVDDPRFNRQWNLRNEGTGIQGNGTPGADIDAEAAWEITTGSPNIKIAILDSGVDTLHPELLGKLMPGFDAMDDSLDTQGYPTPNYDSDGHGTACAGIAAAHTNNGLGVAGVCPDCSVIPIRVFQYQNILGDVQPWSTTEVFMNGINWMWQVGDADVASNSWGVPDFLLAFFPGGDSIVNIAIDAAASNGRGGRGIPMLFSSGNDGISDTIPIWPARYESTIAVGATSMCDEHKSQTSCDNETWWAGNWGEGLDVSAPGVKIPTIDMLGTNGFHNTDYYNTFNGTSAACPNAAGTVGLILSAFPYLPAWAANNALKIGAEKVGDYDYSTWKENGTWSEELGYGRINAYNSLMYAASIGIEEHAESQFLVQTFPNRHQIVLRNGERATWELFDLNGRTVSTGTNEPIISVNHAVLSSGIYALRIRTEKVFETLKILVP